MHPTELYCFRHCNGQVSFPHRTSDRATPAPQSSSGTYWIFPNDSVIHMSKRKDHEAPITSAALLKREAAELLAGFKKKPIVAIDLDYTVRFLYPLTSSFVPVTVFLHQSDMACTMCRSHHWTIQTVPTRIDCRFWTWKIEFPLLHRQKKFLRAIAITLPRVA